MTTLSRSGAFTRTAAAWLNRLPAALALVITGVVLGQQYVNPNKRVVPVLVGVLLFGLAWRIGMLSGIGVLLLALPYPKLTSFGSTNVALILLLLVIWLLRVSQRTSPAPRGTPVDLPLGALLLCYVVSFYNVPDTFFLVRAVQNFELFLGCVLMFYLIVNNIRTAQDLQRFHHLTIASAVTVFLVAVLELNHPGTTFVQGWMDFAGTIGSEFNTRNVRVGSSFHDFELLSEFCAVTLIMVLFQWTRARSYGTRVVYSLVLLLNVFVLFATVTRGAILAGGCGLLVLLWMTRRHLRVVPAMIVGVGSLLFLLGMNYYVAHFTRSGDMFKRLFETQVVQGWMPEDRAEAWQNAWGRIFASHPLIGQGPFYWQVPGYKLWWPHNVYLYHANLIGFIGLAMFLWLLVTLFRLTRPDVDSLSHPDYARAYLLVARTQLVIFMINEFKIDYLRNPVYQFEVWVMFASMVTGYLVAREQLATARAREQEPVPASLVPLAEPA